MWLLRFIAEKEFLFSLFILYWDCGIFRIWKRNTNRIIFFYIKISLCFYMIFLYNIIIIKTALTTISVITLYQAFSDVIGLVISLPNNTMLAPELGWCYGLSVDKIILPLWENLVMGLCSLNVGWLLFKRLWRRSSILFILYNLKKITLDARSVIGILTFYKFEYNWY